MSNMENKSKSVQNEGEYVRPWTGSDNGNVNGGQSRQKNSGRGEKRLRRSTGGSSVNTTLYEVPMEEDASASADSRNVSKSANISREQFKSMSTDDKLVALFGLISHVHEITSRIDNTEHTAYENKRCIDENTRRIKTLEYKSIDLESRSRRNNLVIRGLEESIDENCESKVLNFIRDKLQLDNTKFVIQRAHRIGRRLRGSNKSRPLIVCFRDYSNVTDVIQNAHRLRNTNLSVSRDYPMEITAARSKLWPLYKQAKLSNPRGSVKLVYPAKLIVNGRVTHDEFPDWSDVMGGYRSGPVTYDRTMPDISAPSARTQHGHSGPGLDMADDDSRQAGSSVTVNAGDDPSDEDSVIADESQSLFAPLFDAGRDASDSSQNISAK